jgi:DNA-nicking Smr family endonuclease
MASGKKRKAGGPFDALRALKDELRAKSEQDVPLARGQRESGRGEMDQAAPKKAANPPTQRTPPDAPDDDALLFHRLFAGVKPIDRSRGARLPRVAIDRSDAAQRAAKHGKDAEQAEADAVHHRLRELVEAGARFEVADDGRRVEGRRVDLPLEMLRRLRRGLLPIDARLDLHGMAVKEARGQLELFLRTMRARGERCVLVIHGKGEHSPQGFGVLRGEVAAWLAQGSSSQHIAAFATAREDDGGEGAVYVLLRR